MLIEKVSKTKIVATIGPASESKSKIKELILAGVDVFRFNMKHGELSWHEKVMRRVRKVSKEMGVVVAILMDLQGPEIRSGKVSGGKMNLKKGENVWFSSSQSLANNSEEKMIVIDKEEAIKQLKIGSRVLMDDGFLSFVVLRKKKLEKGMLVEAKVVKGGVLTDCKGINLPGLNLDISILEKKDFECLNIKTKDDIDFVALSFVAFGRDIKKLRKELSRRKIEAGVIAKIERKEALDNFEEILNEADSIMVARGDLGVEVAYHEVPFWQKKIIRRCREVGKPVITATQMLQSMIDSSIPTRAEVSDVANAVYDGTDAVMLSAETSIGRYPIESVKIMKKSALFTESKARYEEVEIFNENMGQTAVVMAAAKKLIKCSNKKICNLSAVVVLTETGTAVRYLSRLRPWLPIIGVTANKKTRDKMKLYWGVEPIYFKFERKSEVSVKKILKYLEQNTHIKKRENVLMIYGDLWGKSGLTSVVRIQAVV